MTPKSLLAPARLAGRPVLRSQSDERLVDLVRAGSEPAFEAIVSRYRAPLLRYCRRILPYTRAEDAVQQAFVSAFAAMRKDEKRIDLRPWLYRITHNTALNALRDRALKDAELDEDVDGVERPDQALERREDLRDAIDAVRALPARQRDAMILRELEGRSYEEIAGALGVTGGAVRQLLNRARTTLRAGVTALTPMPLLLRLGSDAAEPTAARVGELVGAGGAGALATKVAATAIVTGAVAGGVATVPDRDDHRARAGSEPAAAEASQEGVGSAASGESGSAGAATDDHGGKSGEGKDDDSAEDHSGSGDGDDDNSGPGGGGESGDDGGHSGSGRSGSDDGGHSGSGHSGSGDGGGSGSGSGSSGSSGSGSSGSGSGSSGSGTSGGSGDDGGSSGSGSSGSGSSGSGGSGSIDDPTVTTESDSGHSGPS